MPNIDREYLIIPDGTELAIATESMIGRVTRAAQRGERAERLLFCYD